MRPLLAAAFLSAAFSIAHSNVIRVPQDFATIQAAIDAAQTRDTVLLDSGVYVESVEVPSRGLTIAGLFVMSGDTSDIAECSWRGVSNGDDTLRCLSSDEIAGNDPFLRIVGIRFTNSGVHQNEEGGALRIFAQFAAIEHCRFDSCYAGYGGAIAVRQAEATIKNCVFTHCGQLRLASIMRVRSARVLMDSCIVQSDTTFADIFEPPTLFWVQSSKLTVRNSVFRDIGFSHYEWGGTFLYGSKPPDSVEFVGCMVYDNHIEIMITHGGHEISYLRIDSCHFFDNVLTQALYGQGTLDSHRTSLQVNSNVFESFTPYSRAQMHGLFALDTAIHSQTQIKGNLIQNIQGGHTSFCNIYDDNREYRSISHNYILNNSNHSITWPPSGQVLEIGTGLGELEYNVFAGNQGYAVFQGNLNVTSYARHNYWNHATGPYDSVGNFGGQGDTVEWRIQYQPWELDTSFFSAAPEPREPVEIPATFIGNAYPNPFNSIVTIEFVLLHDMEITLDIFDLTGRHVETVHKGRMNKAVHIRDWQPKSQASGIYFARLVGERNVTSTMKLLYLK